MATNHEAPAGRFIRDTAIRNFAYTVCCAICVLMLAKGIVSADMADSVYGVLAVFFGVAKANVPGKE